MLWLFGQTWLWILIAFVLGLVIGFVISWFFREKQIDVTEERITGPVGEKPWRERDLNDDERVSPAPVKPTAGAAPIGGGGLAFAAGGAATGGAAGFVAGRSGDAEADADATDVAADERALAESEPTQMMTPPSTDDAALSAEDDPATQEPALSMIDERDASTAGEAADEAAPAAVESPHGDDAALPLAGGAIGGGTVLGAAAIQADAGPDAPVGQTSMFAADEPETGRIPVLAADGSGVAARPEAPADVAPPAVVERPAGEQSPYGAGSAHPLSGGAAPSEEYTVKGNAASMLFHTRESPYYPRTVAEVWFKSAADAEAAGFTAWNRR